MHSKVMRGMMRRLEMSGGRDGGMEGRRVRREGEGWEIVPRPTRVQRNGRETLDPLRTDKYNSGIPTYISTVISYVH